MPRPTITLSQIRARAAQKSFTRGESLYLNKDISETALRGNVIEGMCEAGSQPEPYHVQATITPDGITNTSCTCLYDFEGDCKHVVALLLTYLNVPTRFEERAPIADTLESCDKADLIALIKHMVKRYPDLQTLIDRPIPGKVTTGIPFDTKAYRKELRRALGQQHEWGRPGAETAVDSIAEAAEAFALEDDWRSASSIYRMIIEESIANTEYFYEDEEGSYGYAIDQIVVAMDECLEHLADDDTERKALLNSLVDFYVAEIDVGDIGADAPDIMLRYARKDDIAYLRRQVEAAREKIAAKRYSEWTVRAYTEFLADLDLLDDVDPEMILLRLRTEGMYSLLIRKLLELKRGKEAIAVMREHLPTPFERMQELPRLVAAGYENEALQLAEEALAINYDRSLVGWLIHTLQMQGDSERAFRWQLEQMKAEPHIAHYNALKTISQQLGNWSLVRPAIIEHLEKTKRYAALTRIYLADEEWDKAWATLPEALKPSPSHYSDHYHLELEVAAATRQTHPQKALPVYICAARDAIKQRSRPSYQEAAKYLVVVRDIYDAIDEYEVWEKLITGIRSEQPRLPALLDELKKAGL